MNVPAVAKKTFDQLKDQIEFKNILDFVLDSLKKISNSIERAKFVHQVIEDYNQEVFSHPLVKQLSPCKLGCSGCCHTQVSVTEDEADLLAKKIKEGVTINHDLLKLQFTAKNDFNAFYKMKFADRRCIFLSDEGSCKIYEDRPSVCRTNAVLGSSAQCDTSQNLKQTVLVRTPKADMAIYASFIIAESSGTLPYLVSKKLGMM